MSKGSRKKVRVLDLFAGAGGLSEGFCRASGRFKAVKAVEFDIQAAASYAANHGDIVYAGPIERWLAADKVPKVDVILGGPPCQGFSTLGKQHAEDVRNQLWRHYAETIRRSEPKYFVVENVAAFLRSPQLDLFREETKPGSSLRDYDFQATVLNAADFGAPQVRKRAVLVGHHRDFAFPGFPAPTHVRHQWITIKEALSGLAESVREVDLPSRSVHFGGKALPGSFRTDELHLTRRYESLSLERFAHIGSGENRFSIPYDLLPDCWRNHTSGSADVMGRLRWDRPAVTIRTEFYKPEKGRYLHPTEHRAITHHEAARLQGFPDDYKWVGSKTSIGRQIGNAVPIPLGEAIGKSLLQTGEL